MPNFRTSAAHLHRFDDKASYGKSMANLDILTTSSILGVKKMLIAQALCEDLHSMGSMGIVPGLRQETVSPVHHLHIQSV